MTERNPLSLKGRTLLARIRDHANQLYPYFLYESKGMGFTDWKERFEWCREQAWNAAVVNMTLHRPSQDDLARIETTVESEDFA